METLREATEPAEAYSPAEERFNRLRSTAGLILAPVTLIALLAASFPSLTPQAHRLAAILATVVVLWITEALPMAPAFLRRIMKSPTRSLTMMLSLRPESCPGVPGV